MAKKRKNIYAVRAGIRTGIFYSWSEVEPLVKGFPNAEYKAFSAVKPATDYLTVESVSLDEPDVHYAYVDGSNLGDGSRYSGSAIIVKNGKVIDSKAMSGNHPDFIAKRNIAGELMGAMIAIKWAVDNNIKVLYICHDYVGVGKWATGEFKARDPLAKMYKAQVDQYMEAGLDLKFIKVDGHTGVEFNELADKVAKEALGIVKKR